MQEYFEIQRSPAQLGLLIAWHGLLAIALAIYVEPLTMKLGSVLLICLLGWRESRQLWRSEKSVLHCNPRTSEIALECGRQSYFYFKYKVYATRWFAILKLVDNDRCRTLILTPDRFHSVDDYQRLRFLLRRLEQHRAA